MYDGPIIDAEWEEIDPDQEDDGILRLKEEMIVKPKIWWIEFLKVYWGLIPPAILIISRKAMRIATRYMYYQSHDDMSWWEILW